MSGLLKTFLSIVLGGGLAYALAIFCRDYPVKRAVPAIFVLVLVLLAHFSSRLACLVTAFVGGLIFAVYLFEPYGHLSVGSATDRVILSCFARWSHWCLPARPLKQDTISKGCQGAWQ